MFNLVTIDGIVTYSKNKIDSKYLYFHISHAEERQVLKCSVSILKNNCSPSIFDVVEGDQIVVQGKLHIDTLICVNNNNTQNECLIHIWANNIVEFK